MADITGFNDGQVAEEGLQNWRGDQTVVPEGAQSIFKSSSVPLARLGARKVVGDRVFRYAQLGAVAATPGDVLQSNFVNQVPTTAGDTNPAGDKKFTYFKTASAAVANFFAEGYVHCVSGTAANTGLMYRIRSHSSMGADTNTSIVLYDPLETAINVTDKYVVSANPYKLVTQHTAGTAPAAGVLCCPATTNDYVWIQTWGPCAVRAQTNVDAAGAMYMAATGAAKGFIATGTGGTVFAQIGQWGSVSVASEKNIGILMIAP
jgi:hypothetical protein